MSAHQEEPKILEFLKRFKAEKLEILNLNNNNTLTPPDLLNADNACRFIDRCPEAMDKCKQSPPKISTESGYVLCWLYE